MAYDGDAAKAIAEVFADFPTFCGLLTIRQKEGPPRCFDYESWFEEQKQLIHQCIGRDIVLKPRQIGISTILLALDLHFALTHPGTNTLVVVHAPKEAEKLFETLHLFCLSLQTLGLLPKRRRSNVKEIVFDAPLNSSIQVVEAGATERVADKKGRSGTIHRLHATEVAFYGAAATTMSAVMSAVPNGAPVIIESTPNGASGTFYDDVMAALDGRSGYKLHFFKWLDHAEYQAPAPRRFDPSPADEHEEALRNQGASDEQIVWWRSKVNDPKVGLNKALQEYPRDVATCFRAAGNAWFDGTVLDRISKFTRDPRRFAPLVFKGSRFEPLSIYREPEQLEDYVVFADVAEGVAGDASSATVIKKSSGEVVATWWSDKTPPSEFGLALAVIGWLYNTALVGVVQAGGAAAISTLTREAKYQRIYRDPSGKIGLLENEFVRDQMWNDLAFAIRDGSAVTPDVMALQECRTLVLDTDGKPRARGKHKRAADSAKDDRYVSWAGAWRLATKSPKQIGSFHIPGL